jgi:hypothetical protein
MFCNECQSNLPEYKYSWKSMIQFSITVKTDLEDLHYYLRSARQLKICDSPSLKILEKMLVPRAG